jgi:hypothetical protein
MRMRWAGHVASMQEMKNKYKFWLESTKGRDRSEDLGLDERIILKLILRKQGGRVWTGYHWWVFVKTAVNLRPPQNAGNLAS